MSGAELRAEYLIRKPKPVQDTKTQSWCQTPWCLRPSKNTKPRQQANRKLARPQWLLKYETTVAMALRKNVCCQNLKSWKQLEPRWCPQFVGLHGAISIVSSDELPYIVCIRVLAVAWHRGGCVSTICTDLWPAIILVPKARRRTRHEQQWISPNLSTWSASSSSTCRPAQFATKFPSTSAIEIWSSVINFLFAVSVLMLQHLAGWIFRSQVMLKIFHCAHGFRFHFADHCWFLSLISVEHVFHQEGVQVSSIRDKCICWLRICSPVWASQDRDPVERAARNFCFGLKKVFKEEWNIPYNVKISEEKLYTMTVGGELALTAHVSPNEVVHEWHGGWANWDELHSSAEVKVLLEKLQALITRTKEGMKGSSKSGPKGHH